MTTDIVPVTGSFNSVSLGTLTLSTLSNVMGEFGSGTGTIQGTLPQFPGFSFSIPLQTISFTGYSLTNLAGGLPALTGSGSSFSFSNLAAGTYRLAASGSVDGFGAAFGGYTVTAVPEPETFAMLLAGLGLMGTIARRRKNQHLAG